MFILANWLPEREDQRNVFPWSSRWGCYRQLARLKARLAARGTPVDFTPHMARHWFGSELGDRQIAERDIMEASIWTSSKSVARYNRARAEKSRETLGQLSLEPPAARKGRRSAS